MELQGKIIQALPQRSGVSQRGEWVAQDFVIETHDQYPRKMVFSVFGGDRLQRFNIQIGQEVLVAFDIDAHEYQGRWFNSIRAYDVRLYDASAMAMSGAAQDSFAASAASMGMAAPASAPVADNGANPAAPVPPQPASSEGGADDLPF